MLQHIDQIIQYSFTSKTAAAAAAAAPGTAATTWNHISLTSVRYACNKSNSIGIHDMEMIKGRRQRGLVGVDDMTNC